MEEKKRMREREREQAREPEGRRTICLPSRLSVFIISCYIIHFIVKHRRTVKLITKHGDLKANIATYLCFCSARETILFTLGRRPEKQRKMTKNIWYSCTVYTSLSKI